jgi:hypothetical protein
MNKFLIAIAALLFSYQFSNAQTEKGNQTLGVNLGFNYTKSSDNSFNSYNSTSTFSNIKVTNFTIGPNYSYFIADKLDIGAALSYSSYTQKNNTDNTDPTVGSLNKQLDKNYGGTLFIRKYFMYANKIGIRTGPYIGYFRNTQQSFYTANISATNDSHQYSNNYQAGADVDLVYYPSKHLGVSLAIANLNYQHNTGNNAYGSNGDHNSGNSVNFNFINNGLNLSLFYNFGG